MERLWTLWSLSGDDSTNWAEGQKGRARWVGGARFVSRDGCQQKASAVQIRKKPAEAAIAATTDLAECQRNMTGTLLCFTKPASLGQAYQAEQCLPRIEKKYDSKKRLDRKKNDFFVSHLACLAPSLAYLGTWDCDGHRIPPLSRRTNGEGGVENGDETTAPRSNATATVWYNMS